MTQLYDLSTVTLGGENKALADFRGKVLLIVNTASQCGLTPQYEGLEALYQAKKDQGLEILGFPANDFKQQEPGSNADIAEFCQVNYGVTFPLFAKSTVVGASKNPVFKVLIDAQPKAIGEGPHRERLKGFGITPNDPPEVLWNFEKFLVNRNGEVVARFAPDTTPDDPKLVGAIERLLAE